jgi:hypothetical protein
MITVMIKGSGDDDQSFGQVKGSSSVVATASQRQLGLSGGCRGASRDLEESLYL